MKILKIVCLLAISVILFNGCDKDDDSTSSPEYDIPTTYDFDNVNYSGQEQRIAMLTELKTYMKSANTPNTILDTTRLKAMYTNDAANAYWTGSYDTTKQLKDKIPDLANHIIEPLLEELAMISESTVSAAEGQAGVATSLDGTKNYLLNTNGVEYGQVIEKSLMGALLYFQATSIYLGSDKMNTDNETVEPGRGTDMEHSWDEAFGYFGIPKGFPSDTEPLYFWGDYCNDRNLLIGTNIAIMDAFLKGRAAISNKDIATRDEAIVEVRTAWENIIVGTALHYINGSLEDFDDKALRTHQLSEAAAFIYCLHFNSAKSISNGQINELLILLGGTNGFTTMNFYQTEKSKLEETRDILAAYYNYEGLKEQF